MLAHFLLASLAKESYYFLHKSSNNLVLDLIGTDRYQITIFTIIDKSLIAIADIKADERQTRSNCFHER